MAFENLTSRLSDIKRHRRKGIALTKENMNDMLKESALCAHLA